MAQRQGVGLDEYLELARQQYIGQAHRSVRANSEWWETQGAAVSKSRGGSVTPSTGGGLSRSVSMRTIAPDFLHPQQRGSQRRHSGHAVAKASNRRRGQSHSARSPAHQLSAHGEEDQIHRDVVQTESVDVQNQVRKLVIFPSFPFTYVLKQAALQRCCLDKYIGKINSQMFYWGINLPSSQVMTSEMLMFGDDGIGHLPDFEAKAAPQRRDLIYADPKPLPDDENGQWSIWPPGGNSVKN